MRIALLGGAFDPPHFGHVLNITRILNSGFVDEVWIVPSGDRTEKKYHTSASHRKAMSELLCAIFESTKVKLCSVQIKEVLPGSYTIDLLHYLQNTYPSEKFFMVIGTDLVRDLPRWKEGEKLLSDAHFLLVSRPSETIPDISSIRHIVEVPDNFGLYTSVSSTVAREMIRNRAVLEGIIPEKILGYIFKNNLYSGIP